MGFEPRHEDPDNTLLFKIASLLESQVGAGVSSFNSRTGAVSLSSADVNAALAAGSLTLAGPVTVTSFVESGFIFSHFKDATTNIAPVSAEVYHETTGTPAAGFGASLDLSMDDATVKRQVGARFISSWTVAADATRTSQLRIFLPSAGTLTQVLAMSPTTLGFYGVAAVARPSVPDGSSLATVIDALQALGLFNPV